MSTFRELLVEKSSVIDRAKRYFKNKVGTQEYTFIVPFMKDVKQVETEKEYGLFVDWNESVVYDIDNNPKFMAINKEFQYFVVKEAKRLNNKIKTEEDGKNTFYYFVSGIGYKSDIEDFINDKFRGVPYKMSKWKI